MKDRNKNRSNRLSWGLFGYSWKYPLCALKNTVKDFFILLGRVNYVLKHGYLPQATWETSIFFIDIMREILQNYRDNRTGSPCFKEEDLTTCRDDYDKVLDKMIELLNKMDETSYEDTDDIFQNQENYEKMYAAKDEFFSVFSKYFYCLWD